MLSFRKFALLASGVVVLSSFLFFAAQPVGAGGFGGAPRGNAVPEPPRTLVPYFTPVSTPTLAPDSEGYIRRWLLLEPIDQGLRTNAGLNEAFVQKAIKTEYFNDQFTLLPKDGDKVTVNNEPLAWHALDSTAYNVKIFRFAYGLNKKSYGVLYWAVTYIDCPRDIPNVRLSVGSNSASIWWIDGKEVIDIYGDKHMMVDDYATKRMTLTKGRHVIRVAVINGPGLSDFCAHFVDEDRKPITDFVINLSPSQN